MYNLGEQFNLDYALAIPNKSNIIKGNKYRFTILSDSLIRLEYCENGMFIDEPTKLVWYRNMNPVSFKYDENDKMLVIITSYFKLTYHKEKPFLGSKLNPMANLKVEVLNSDRIWYYGHPEVRNFGSPGLSLENTDDKIKLQKGLYSLDGFVTIDDSKDDIMSPNGLVTKRTNNGIDIYLFVYNKDFHQCLKDYYSITGYPNLIPRYALGNWWYKNETYSSESCLALTKEFEDKGIPISLLLLNNNWNITEKNTFTWNNALFKNPSYLIQELHHHGVRLGLSINPLDGIFKEEANYSTILKYLQEIKGTVPFNVYDPTTLDAYFKILINPLNMIGIDFYYLDIDDKKHTKELGILDHYQFMDIRKNYKTRPMVVSRNDGVARHRYPVTYVGKSIVSWDSLKMVSLLNIASTNIGNNYLVHDIGGYYKGVEDSELYMRYIQLGVFSPILKLGSDAGVYYKREPWKWSFKTYKIVKDYLNLRHKMIPYLYSEFYKYSGSGLPVITPIYYKYSELYDDSLYKNEYYFGSQMFISPIVKKKDYITNRVIHKLFLPEGRWYHFNTGKKYVGKTKLMGFFKDEDYPCFAKEGAIIPLTNYKEDMNINDTTPPKNLEIQVFPGKNNTYDLYEDDGLSELYRRGYYIVTNIASFYTKHSRRIIVQAKEGKTGIIPSLRDYKIKFRNSHVPSYISVKLNNVDVPYETKIADNDFIVKVSNISTLGILEVEIKGDSLDIESLDLFKDSVISILQDLPIETLLKEKVENVLFKEEVIKKKRIEVRKLERKGLEKKFVNLFLKLLEYLE